MSPLELSSLSSAARWAVTLSSFTLVVVSARALGRRDLGDAGGRATPWLPFLAALAVAAAFAHIPPLTARLPVLFPVGLGLGLLAAFASLFVPGARRAFSRLGDADLRLMLSFRAIFGAMLFGLAGVGIMPPRFALAAGLGDLVVGWLALAAPQPLDAEAPRPWRLLVHGLGLVDLVQVVVLAVTVVRPWSDLHANATDTVTLPWVAVPLMLALNLHGFWQACAARQREPGRHGPEPVADVRSAVSRT